MKTARITKLTLILLGVLLIISACSSGKSNVPNTNEDEIDFTEVTMVLNWYPNTNHTGFYAAQELGYYEEVGIKLNIIPPGVSGANAIVGSGEAEFGIGIQESVTEARIQDVPIVSIAALMQHNTSVFASPAEKNITRPKDFEGKIYGGFGSPAEPGVIRSLMEADGGDADQVTIINVGEADFFTAIQRDIDFGWIFYGWDGIKAELENIPLNFVYLTDYSKKLDYYTPILITNEKMIAEQPELVRAFVAATAKGFQYAMDHPEEAAQFLLKASPDLDEELVIASQKWISPRYQDDAEQWGIQKLSVWENYASWMNEHGLLEGEFNAEEAFTNEFLPESKK